MKKTFTFILALIFTIWVMSEIGSCGSGSTYKADPEIEAFTYGTGFVEKVLKAPSTADFCGYSDATIYPSGAGYIVSGWVDAQNSYGAMIRSTFSVTLHQSGSNWVCDELIFDGQEVN